MDHDELAKLRIDKALVRPSRRPRRKALYWGVAVAVALAAIFFIRGGWRPRVTIEAVTVSQVYPSQTFTLLNASGYVVAQRKAAVASKATGRLEWLGVEEGSRVTAGEILARLEDRDVVATRAEAAANLTSARATLEQAHAELNDATLAYGREKELLGQGIVARADFDAAEARYRKAIAGVAGARAGVVAAEAALRGAEAAVEYTLIRAPFDGVVLTKNADVGDIITPLGAAANAKAAVVTIADLGSLEVEVDVSESNLEKVRVGQPCEIQLDALPDRRFRGEVHTIVPTADRSKATVLVKVRFIDTDKRVLPEMSAKVAFLERPETEAEKRPKTAVSPAAVATRNGRSVLFIVRGERVVATPVTIGAKIGDMVEILAGAKGGERVAVSPLDKLDDGTRIAVAEK